MVDAVNRNDCCGCEACAQSCPSRCIDMREDEEGFLFPKVDTPRCIKCGRCLKVCPALNKGIKRRPTDCFAYRTKDVDLLQKTSSGGFFTAAANKVLDAGGIVFGAAFNAKNEVVHAYVECSEELDSLRRSKYVQSRVGEAFIKCREFLVKGRKVLFCGTPCQIKALKLFLIKNYDNLTTIDFVCHGVPSPGVYRRYLEELAKKKGHPLSELHDVNFRDKGLGYAYSFSFSFSFSFYRENPRENIFLKGFLNDLYLRRSCYNCKSKCFSSGADYTMCDFWTVNKFLPGFADKTIPGVSQVFVLNDKLGLFANTLADECRGLDVRDRRLIQCWAVESVPLTHRRERFFNKFTDGGSVEVSVLAASSTTLPARFCRRLRGCVGCILRKLVGR